MGVPLRYREPPAENANLIFGALAERPRPESVAKARRPLVSIDGRLKELPAGDYVPMLQSRSITLQAPTDSEDITLLFAEREITLQSVRGVLIGSSSPSLSIAVRFGPDRSQAGTVATDGNVAITSLSGGDVVKDFGTAVIPAGSWLWLTTAAKSGTIDNANVTVAYQ